MTGWLVTMMIFAGIAGLGLVLHAYEEYLQCVKIKLDSMSTFGSIVFFFGVIGFVFSFILTLMCI